MANRYWVGGTGTWNTTSTTNWSASSGGTGGVSVPTSADAVFFDANSGTGTVTVGAAVVALSIDFTGFTQTFAGTNTITVYSNVTLSSNMTCTYSSGITWANTGTIITAGKTLTFDIGISAAGKTLYMGDALTQSYTKQVYVIDGNFDTNSYALNVSSIHCQQNYTNRGIYLRNSTITHTPTSATQLIGLGYISADSANKLTVDCGTSTINCTGYSSFATPKFITYYNINITQPVSIIIGNMAVAGNLNITNRDTVGISTVSVTGNVSITGGFNFTPTAINKRTLLKSNTLGTRRTITAGSASLTHVDLIDIAFDGGALNTVTTACGNGANNTGLIFPEAPKTVYYNLSGATNGIFDVAFASTSGGTPDISNFPLAQDTIVMNNSSIGNLRNCTGIVGTIDLSARTTAHTFSASDLYLTGSLKMGSGTSITVQGNITMIGGGTATRYYQTSGKQIGFVLTVYMDSTATLEFLDAIIPYMAGSGKMYLTKGQIKSNSYYFTSWELTITTPDLIDLGTSTVLMSGYSSRFEATNIADTDYTIKTVAYASTVALTSDSPVPLNRVLIQPNANVIITLSGRFYVKELVSVNPVGSWTLSIPAGPCRVQNFNIKGTAGNIITVRGPNGTSRGILRKDTPWYVGANSTDGGNNVGITFADDGSGIDYLNLVWITGTMTKSEFMFM